MCNKDKTPLWRRLLSGAAVCMGFTLTTLSASYGSVCILGDEGCDGDPAYTSFAEDLCIPDGKTVFECDSPAVKEKEEAGQTCTKIDGCENSCTCKEPDCQAMGYTLPGFDFEEADEYTSNGIVNASKAIEYSDWPSNYQLDAHNDAESYACFVCTIGGKHRKQDGIYYWKCESNQICADSENEATRIVGSRKATLERLKSECSARTKDSSERYEFIEGTSRNNNYVCGRCVQNAENCPNGEPNTNNPSGCALRCGDDNPRNRSTYTGESVRLATGEVVQCCYFREMDTTCTCDETLIAQYDPAKPNNAGCTGHAWNNDRAEADPGAAHCTCINKPCEEGSAVVTDASGLTENAQGYWVFKKDNKCYAKKFVNWKGMEDGKDEACYKDIDMEADMSKPAGERFVEPCQEGEEFNTDTCECVPLECPEGWSIYAQTTTPIYQPYASNAGANDAKGMIVGYTYKENTSRYLFGADSVNKTLDLPKAAEEAVALGCSTKFDGKGWKIVYADENGKTHRAALKNGDTLVKIDGKYQIYQCGYCAPKTCKDGDAENLDQEYNKDESQNLTPESHCFGGSKLLKTYVDKYEGDEQCVTCPWCWDVDSVRNSCYDKIKNENLVTCWSENGDRFGKDVEPLCDCAGTFYYRNCYMLKPDQSCSFFNYWPDKSAQQCTLATVTVDQVKSGKLRQALKYNEDARGNITTEKLNIPYANPYIISQCQHPGKGGSDKDYVVAYISECTAQSNCQGHGPAWNPDYDNGDGTKGHAMKICNSSSKSYGIGTGVSCGGEDWFDECGEDICEAIDPAKQDDLNNCPDDYDCEAMSVTGAHSEGSLHQGQLYNSHYFLTEVACRYNNLKSEKWFYEDCEAEGNPGYNRYRYDEVAGMICGNPIPCGDSYASIDYFDKDSCTELDTEEYEESPGSGCYCNGTTQTDAQGTEYCDGEWICTKCDSDQFCDEEEVEGYCPGQCLGDKCKAGDEYCDGETNEEGFCLGTCKAFSCANHTRAYQSGSSTYCNDSLVTLSDADLEHGYTDDSSALRGQYIARLSCAPTAEEIEAGAAAEYKYVTANCSLSENDGNDCSGGQNPVYGMVDCSGTLRYDSEGNYDPNGSEVYTVTAPDNVEAKRCGGDDYYKPEDCVKVEHVEEVETCPSIDNGMDSTDETVPGGYEDTGYTCTLSGVEHHYYVPCNADSYTIDGVKTGAGSVKGYADCGEDDGTWISSIDDSKTCGGHFFARIQGTDGTCARRCNYDWNRETCEAITVSSFKGVFQPSNDEGCDNIYGSCQIDGVTLSSHALFTSVFDDGWCKKSKDPNWANHNCGDMLTD